VVKDHPNVSVAAEPPEVVGDGVDDLRRHAPAITWTMPTGHLYRLPPPPALDWGSRPSPLKAPPSRDAATVVEEIRSRLDRHEARREHTRSPRQSRRRAARRERRTARLKLSAWRESRDVQRRDRRQSIGRRQVTTVEL